jgi:ribosomal protein L32
MAYPDWGTAPIKCGNRKCAWVGKETELKSVPRDQNPGEIPVSDNVCPKCGCNKYSFLKKPTGRKRR